MLKHQSTYESMLADTAGANNGESEIAAGSSLNISSSTNNPPPSTSSELDSPVTSKTSNNTNSIQPPSSWLQSSGNEYLTKGQAILDSLTNSSDSGDVAKKYEEFVSFVHGSVAEIKKYIDTRPDIADIESKLTKVECDQIRRVEQVNYLTSQCRGWWVMSDKLQNENPRTYKNLWPWLGSKDKRSACQYVEEFIEWVLSYCSNSARAIGEFTDRLILEPEDGERFRVNRTSTFQQCVEKFIERFSTDDVFYSEIACFEKAVPIDSKYYDFALFWLSKFRYNPRVDPYWVLDTLIKKLPERYESSLQNLKKNFDVSHASILKTIYDRAAYLKDPVPELCKYLGYHVIPNERGAPSNGHYATDEVEEKRKTNPRKKRTPKSAEDIEFERQFRKELAIRKSQEKEVVAKLLQFRMLPLDEALERRKEFGF